jgi:hypothetical protein
MNISDKKLEISLKFSMVNLITKKTKQGTGETSLIRPVITLDAHLATPYTDLLEDWIKGGMVSNDQPSPSRPIWPSLLHLITKETYNNRMINSSQRKQNGVQGKTVS